MPQDIINLIISGAAGILGWLLRIVWENQEKQRIETRELVDKVNSIEVVVAGQYVRRDELSNILNRIDSKLDTISIKLDSKADK